LSALRTFYRFLNATAGVEVNPARAMRSPKLPRLLPAHLDRSEIERLFADAAQRAARGGVPAVRDLAMLELFYSSGGRLPGRAGGGGNGGPSRGVREPARPAAVRAGRAARDQAAVHRPGPRPRAARPFTAALLRHAPTRRRGRPAGGAGAAGPRFAQHHASVYSYVGGALEAGVPPGPSEGLKERGAGSGEQA